MPATAAKAARKRRVVIVVSLPVPNIAARYAATIAHRSWLVIRARAVYRRPQNRMKEDIVAQSLPKRALGKSGINVSAIGLGCMSFSGTYGPSEDAAAIALIHEALEQGIAMFDSSDAYGKGQNETLLGNALK